MSVKIFFCYAREDEKRLDMLKTHLRPLEHQRLIDIWYDREIHAGDQWEKRLESTLMLPK
jgi:hypothetical protein